MAARTADRPQEVELPKRDWVLIDVLLKKPDWSLALGEREGERCFAIGWNRGDAPPKGNLASRRILAWFVLPKDLTALLLSSDLLSDEQKSVARRHLAIPAAGNRWDDFFLNSPRVSDDFMRERDQPPEREPF